MSYSIRLYSDLTQHPLYQTVSHASPLSRRLLLYLFSSFRLKILTVQELLPYSMTYNGGLFTSIVSFSLGIARCILYVYCVTLIGIHTEACVLLIWTTTITVKMGLRENHVGAPPVWVTVLKVAGGVGSWPPFGILKTFYNIFTRAKKTTIRKNRAYAYNTPTPSSWKKIRIRLR